MESDGTRRRKADGQGIIKDNDVEKVVTKLPSNDDKSKEKPFLKAKKVQNWWGICGLLTMFACCGLALAIIYFLSTRLGFGDPFPDQGLTKMKPILTDAALEIVAELPAPAGNIAVSPSGRIFFNFHPENGLPEKILELTSRTTYAPYPNTEFQSKIITCLSLRIDGQNRLWLLDYAQHGFGGAPKLFGFALGDSPANDELVVEYEFAPEVAGKGSMLNDFVIDISDKYIYIVDTSIVAMNPGIVVYSIEDNKAYRLLSSHSSMFGRSIFLNIMGTLIKFGPFGLTVNIDSVALDRSGDNLYYGAVTSDAMYSISTSHLLGAVRRLREFKRDTLTPAENEVFSADVLRLVLAKPVSDGLTTDSEGNIWISGIEHGALFIAKPISVSKDGEPIKQSSVPFNRKRYDIIKVVENHSLLRWPDGFSFGPDGLYITNSALHINFGRLGKIQSFAPFHILRLNKQELRGIVGLNLPPAGQ